MYLVCKFVSQASCGQSDRAAPLCSVLRTAGARSLDAGAAHAHIRRCADQQIQQCRVLPHRVQISDIFWLHDLSISLVEVR